MRFLLMAFLLLAVAGCASDQRSQPPVRSWTSDRTPEDLGACMIPALDARTKAALKFDPDVVHKFDTLLPGKTYEIRTLREITVGVDRYFIRLTVRESGGTLIEAFADTSFRYLVLDVVGECLGLSAGNQSTLFKKR